MALSRTQRAFERRYHELLAELGARDRAKGIRWFHERSRLLVERGAPSVSHAHTELLIALLRKVHRFHANRGAKPPVLEGRLYCDAGLGGLARWLRASAFWTQDITDPDLMAEAERLQATIITTDSPLLDRRLIAHGHVRAIWVPPTLTMHEQLRLVLAELGLPEADPSLDSRCMRCGGELVDVAKEEVKDRIPPRTYKWLDEYYECRLCGQLFWHGTHWERIQQRLGLLSSVSS